MVSFSFTFASNDIIANTGTTTSTGSTEEVICTTIFAPVCDKDGKMYSNSCLAKTPDTSFDYCNKPINLGDEQEILDRAYTNNITKFNTLSSFQWASLITRAQAAKMLSVRSKLIYPELGQTSKLSCHFDDINDQASDLQDYIIQSCQYGLFQGYQWHFMPKDYITKGQMLIVLKRFIAIKYVNIQERPEKVLSWKAFYDTAGDTVNKPLDRTFFLTLLAHSYNMLSDSLSFNSGIF